MYEIIKQYSELPCDQTEDVPGNEVTISTENNQLSVCVEYLTTDHVANLHRKRQSAISPVFLKSICY